MHEGKRGEKDLKNTQNRGINMREEIKKGGKDK